MTLQYRLHYRLWNLHSRAHKKKKKKKRCIAPETHLIAIAVRKVKKETITSEKDLNQGGCNYTLRAAWNCIRAHTARRETAKDERANVIVALTRPSRNKLLVCRVGRETSLETSSERFKYRYLHQPSPIIPREDFLLRRSRFQQLFAIHRKDNFAFGEGSTPGIPATIHPRLRLSACLIFRIYRPWGNNVPPEISMTVGVYGYDPNMEIKHFRAPRKMHTFPLANPWKPSFEIPSNPS